MQLTGETGMSIFYPDEYLESTYIIDFDKLYRDGYRGLIFDIDNTLVPHGAPADERAIALFAHLKELGFACTLLSNNKEPRVKMFNDAVHVHYIFKAGKPNPANYKKAMEIYRRENLNDKADEMRKQLKHLNSNLVLS